MAVSREQEGNERKRGRDQTKTGRKICQEKRELRWKREKETERGKEKEEEEEKTERRRCGREGRSRHWNGRGREGCTHAHFIYRKREDSPLADDAA